MGVIIIQDPLHRQTRTTADSIKLLSRDSSVSDGDICLIRAVTIDAYRDRDVNWNSPNLTVQRTFGCEMELGEVLLELIEEAHFSPTHAWIRLLIDEPNSIPRKRWQLVGPAIVRELMASRVCILSSSSPIISCAQGC